MLAIELKCDTIELQEYFYLEHEGGHDSTAVDIL